MPNSISNEDTLSLIGSDIPETSNESAPDCKAEKEEAEYHSNPVDEKKYELAATQARQSAAFHQQLLDASNLYNLRKNVAIFIFSLISVWLVCVMGLVFLGSYEVVYFHGACAGYDNDTWYDKFKLVPETCAYLRTATHLNLSESIVIALITTTTVNVLGLSYIVSRWLFPSENNVDK